MSNSLDPDDGGTYSVRPDQEQATNMSLAGNREFKETEAFDLSRYIYSSNQCHFMA